MTDRPDPNEPLGELTSSNQQCLVTLGETDVGMPSTSAVADTPTVMHAELAIYSDLGIVTCDEISETMAPVNTMQEIVTHTNDSCGAASTSIEQPTVTDNQCPSNSGINPIGLLDANPATKDDNQTTNLNNNHASQHTTEGASCVVQNPTTSQTGIPADTDATVTFSSLVTPKSACSQVRSGRRRQVAHAKVITSSPFKKSLEESKRKKQEKESKPKSVTRKPKPIPKLKLTKQKQNWETENQSESDDSKPLSVISRKHKIMNTKKSKKKHNVNSVSETDAGMCSFCGGIYNSADDPHGDESWIQCTKCKKWFHEHSYAEQNGVFDELRYYCIDCI